ncbi:MAG: hypothetical protein Kow0092_10870 [Deferrisomatales bacterium]
MAAHGEPEPGRGGQHLRVYLPGWEADVRLAETPGGFRRLDPWVRHRLRAVQLRQWKRERTAYHALRRRGASAAGTRRWGPASYRYLHAVLTRRFPARRGLPQPAP